MVTRKNILISLLSGAALLFPTLLEAQAGPFNGEAALILSSTRSSISAGEAVDVKVEVDLTGLSGRRGNGATSPAVLGGYVVAISFDNTRLRFESASGGAGEFSPEPTYRMPALANAAGAVAVAGVQTSSDSPTGRIHVATLSFTATRDGLATVTAVAESLSSAFQFPAAGPSAIASSGTSLTFGIAASGGLISAPPPSTIIPVAGSLPGSGGSYFRTSLQLFNGGSMMSSGRVTFYPRGVLSEANAATLDYSLAPGQSVGYDDVVAAMGQTGLGTLDIVADHGPLPAAFARLFNDHGNGGTSGMSVDGVRPIDAQSKGSRTVLLVPPDLDASRFNVGLRTLGEGATVKLTVADRNGDVISRMTREFPANFFDQQSAEAMVGSKLSGSESLTIEIEAGSAIIYGATTDNTTQDPTLHYARLLPVE